jgi:hypothetical protein
VCVCVPTVRQEARRRPGRYIQASFVHFFHDCSCCWKSIDRCSAERKNDLAGAADPAGRRSRDTCSCHRGAFLRDEIFVLPASHSTILACFFFFQRTDASPSANGKRGGPRPPDALTGLGTAHVILSLGARRTQPLRPATTGGRELVIGRVRGEASRSRLESVPLARSQVVGPVKRLQPPRG